MILKKTMALTRKNYLNPGKHLDIIYLDNYSVAMKLKKLKKKTAL